MPRLICRPLTNIDLPAIVHLDQLCFGGLWSLDGYRRELDSPNSDLIVLSRPEAIGATEAIIGIGSLWAILDEAHITLLGIAPSHRGLGLGQWLLGQLLWRAHHRQLARATLEVRPSNQAALAIYSKFGFTEAGRRHHYYADDEDAMILWRSGLRHPDYQAQWRQTLIPIHQRLQSREWRILQGDAASNPLANDASFSEKINVY
ncbi:Putative ribosomal-protein-alanine acetyltransferase [Halomicronema hongdechloris C2206]|uniref:Ribosomal-protein-alanine acetyltransferase n=1 Tax=Halomicronema hongdechloris C2206 TaxID=1641165 RepID=A0A1Z3HG30_9CYAN|nr:GNAT family N-acetyltransferase [Halomicronema hongdechloris]ASC69250.1 Putative ribosomal-protein-alanine acetyltransferase [Halomicronema hongdechloris C2206]